MKKEKTRWQNFFFYFLLFIFGLLLGYFLGSHHEFNKYIQTPYTDKIPTSAASCDALSQITPLPGAKVTSPLTVTVTVDNTKNCKWTVFEAQAGTVILKDDTGQTLGNGILQTTEDWMTEKPVTYTATFTFTKPTTHDLTLIITEEDPSGNGTKSEVIPLTY